MYVCLSIFIDIYRAFWLKHTYIHGHVTTFWPPIFPCMFQNFGLPRQMPISTFDENLRTKTHVLSKQVYAAKAGVNFLWESSSESACFGIHTRDFWSLNTNFWWESSSESVISASRDAGLGDPNRYILGLVFGDPRPLALQPNWESGRKFEFLQRHDKYTWRLYKEEIRESPWRHCRNPP